MSLTEIKSTQYSLDAIFDNQEARSVFETFLRNSKTHEPLLFIENVQDYTLLRSSARRQEFAQKIIKLFIQDDSQYEINIPSTVKQKIVSNFAEMVKRGEMKNDLFAPALSVVWSDLSFDNFPRFLKSDLFRQWATKKHKELGHEQFKKMFVEEVSEQQDVTSSKKDKVERMSIWVSNKKIPQRVNLNLTAEELEKLKTFNKKYKLFDDVQEEMNELVSEMMKFDTGVPLTKSPHNIFKISDLKDYSRCFLGKDMIAWLKQYLKCEDDEVISQIISILLNHKAIALTKNTKNVSENIYHFLIKKKLIIVGSGYAGITVAKELAEEFDITVIECKPHFEYNCAFHYLFGNPSQIFSITCPVEKLVAGCKVVQDLVMHISPHAVYTKKNGIFSFDYLIVCTGSSYVIPFPVEQTLKGRKQTLKGEYFNSSENDEEEDKPATIILPYTGSSILRAIQDLRDAKSIVVIGGGAVAVECFGEIAHYYHKTAKQITLLSQAGTLMERVSPSAHSAAYEVLTSYPNTQLYFNRIVTRIVQRKVYYKLYNTKSNNKDQVSHEHDLTADVVVVCTGYRPNTKIFRKFMIDSLDSRGRVMVNEFFQVKKEMHSLTEEQHLIQQQKEFEKQTIEALNKICCESITIQDDDSENLAESFYDKLEKSSADLEAQRKSISKDKVYNNIFALGDIADADYEKLAYHALAHARAVVKFIRAQEQNSKYKPMLKAVKPYVSTSGNTFQLISLGPKKGIALKGTKLLSRGKLALRTKDLVLRRFTNTLKKLNDN